MNNYTLGDQCAISFFIRQKHPIRVPLEGAERVSSRLAEGLFNCRGVDPLRGIAYRTNDKSEPYRSPFLRLERLGPRLANTCVHRSYGDPTTLSLLGCSQDSKEVTDSVAILFFRIARLPMSKTTLRIRVWE